MLNRIVKSVVQAMSDTLTSEQLQRLQDVLYINFQGTKVTKDETEIVEIDGISSALFLTLETNSLLSHHRERHKDFIINF
ncbi:hypothetical protein [Clostridium sp. AF22-10]|uniref:hypothetical protein n=1 Tax=Clostridium sp. AF22-10 TaxID=2293004 RepID=UPI000E553264|nr:hypothetical protein DWX91_13045 [Clostridium sp. AF22-10]